MEKGSEILIDSGRIKSRIRELAAELAPYCRGGCTLLWLREGAAPFAEEFRSCLSFPIKSVGVRVSSYGLSQTSSGMVEISEEISSVREGRVLLMDDILDTGNTAEALCAKLRSQGVEEIKTCFLLAKSRPGGRRFSPDFVGFEIPDFYVYGFGLDLEGRMRGLPDIYFLKG